MHCHFCIDLLYSTWTRQEMKSTRAVSKTQGRRREGQPVEEEGLSDVVEAMVDQYKAHQGICWSIRRGRDCLWGP